ncbi:MAG: hypothetical protein MZV70_37885 [Desulfobacterales bacterium]|nr:hypothetical protein [Desulfobacterales bacterium]
MSHRGNLFWRGITAARISTVSAFGRYILRWFQDLSFLGNYHRVSAQLQQVQDASLNTAMSGNISPELARQLMALIYLLGLLHLFSKANLGRGIFSRCCGGCSGTRCTDRHAFVLLLASRFFVLFIWVFYFHDQMLLQGICSRPAVLLRMPADRVRH